MQSKRDIIMALVPVLAAAHISYAMEHGTGDRTVAGWAFDTAEALYAEGLERGIYSAEEISSVADALVAERARLISEIERQDIRGGDKTLPGFRAEMISSVRVAEARIRSLGQPIEDWKFVAELLTEGAQS